MLDQAGEASSSLASSHLVSSVEHIDIIISGTRYGPDGKHDEENGSKEEMIVPKLEALIKSPFFVSPDNFAAFWLSFGRIDLVCFLPL